MKRIGLPYKKALEVGRSVVVRHGMALHVADLTDLLLHLHDLRFDLPSRHEFPVFPMSDTRAMQ